MKVLQVSSLLLLALVVRKASSINRQERSLLYPKAGICKLIIGMAVPVDLPKKILSWTANFQFQYKLPANATELHTFPEVGRALGHGLDRAAVYGILETLVDRQGLDGRACVLKSICELAQVPIHFHNGLFGDLLQLILSPGPNTSQEVDKEYYEAQRLGSEGTDCRKVFSKCVPGKGILDNVSFIYDDGFF